MFQFYSHERTLFFVPSLFLSLSPEFSSLSLEFDVFLTLPRSLRETPSLFIVSFNTKLSPFSDHVLCWKYRLLFILLFDNMDFGVEINTGSTAFFYIYVDDITGVFKHFSRVSHQSAGCSRKIKRYFHAQTVNKCHYFSTTNQKNVRKLNNWQKR